MTSIITIMHKKRANDPHTEAVELKMRESERMRRLQRTTSKSDVGFAVGDVKIFKRTIRMPMNAKTTIYLITIG